MAMNTRVDSFLLQVLQSWSALIVLQEMETYKLELI